MQRCKDSQRVEVQSVNLIIGLESVPQDFVASLVAFSQWIYVMRMDNTISKICFLSLKLVFQ